MATQDRSLQQKISNKPAGAIIFATVNGIQMEMPSEKQKNLVSKSVQEKLMPGILEIQSNMVSPLEDKTAHQSFRKKKAKGPNPLSMKKASKRAGQHEGTHHRLTNTNTEAAAKKPSRVRKSRSSNITTSPGI